MQSFSSAEGRRRSGEACDPPHMKRFLFLFDSPIHARTCFGKSDRLCMFGRRTGAVWPVPVYLQALCLSSDEGEPV